MPSRRPFRLSLLLALLATSRTLAAEPAATASDKVEKAVEHAVDQAIKWGDLFRTTAFSMVIENDKFFAGTDRHYTNGLKLSFLGDTRVNESPNIVQKITKVVPTLNSETAKQQTYKVGISLGQNLYTPSNVDTAAPLPDDRPYASWLYASLTFQAQSPDARLLRVVELSLGIVGPSAIGRQTQNTVHGILGIAKANGWANQLHDEPGLLLSWERRYRVGKISLPLPGLETDLIVRGGVSLGNIRTNLATGLAVRLGWQLPSDFGADLIRPAGGGLIATDKLSFYAFGSAESRYVVHDIFLDGNTWRDSISVDKRTLTGDLNIGLVVRLPLSGPRLKGVQVTYTQNYRTKEFYGQLHRDVFGSVGLTFLY